MNHSIRTRMAVILLVILTFIVACTWVLNATFAPAYYIASEKKKLHETYKEIEKILNQESVDRDEIITWVRTQRKNNTRFLIIHQDDVLYQSQEQRAFSNMRAGSEEYSQNLSVLYSLFCYTKGLQEDNTKYSFQIPGKSATLFKFSDIYSRGYTMETIPDEQGKEQDIMLVGLMKNGYMITLSVSLEDIRTAARANSVFLGYMGLIGILIGSIIIFIFSRRFTDPIKEMASVANKMSNLDFNAKLQVNTRDELGELAKSMNVMSQKLEETIADLKTANLQLQKDIQKKEEIDEMRKEFLSHVSHELKTPIALIQGYAEGLKDGIIEDEESKDFYCEVIMDEAHKMNKMVKKILTLNQIEFGNDTLKIVRFDLASMISYKISSNSILFRNKNVKVKFDQEGQSCYVWGDEFMIEEVVSNYLSNALNHVRTEGVIRIWLEKREKDIRTHVYNEGERIPEDSLHKLWTKFYKVDKARTREYGGNGIGLSIVEASMRAHEKSYGVCNHEDGVEFYFDLEFCETQA